MYAFGPLPKYKQSGRVIGTHQKIDRVARRHLKPFLKNSITFPGIQSIIHFEGSRGPDGIKMKSPGKDEPWHFIDPANMRHDDVLLVAIRDHQHNLTRALVNQNDERAAYEAAWLAHAVTDGLTPAHHDPLDEQVKDLRHSDDRRHSIRSRVIMQGNGSKRQFVKNNWAYWGTKGIMTTHALFEGGVATSVKPLSFDIAMLTQDDISHLNNKGFEQYYMAMIRKIDGLQMYSSFKQKGWTQTLARQTTKELVPTIIRAVTLAWYESYVAALEAKG